MNLNGKVEIAALTDTGRVRSRNEDSILAHPQLGLAVLADGMGGYRGGNVASAMAVTTVGSVLEALLPRLRSAQRDADSGVALESIAVSRAITMATVRILFIFRSP